MPARKWIQRVIIRKLVLKSDGTWMLELNSATSCIQSPPDWYGGLYIRVDAEMRGWSQKLEDRQRNLMLRKYRPKNLQPQRTQGNTGEKSVLLSSVLPCALCGESF